MSDHLEHPLQQWPVISLMVEYEPDILAGGPELFVRLQLETRESLTAHDG